MMPTCVPTVVTCLSLFQTAICGQLGAAGKHMAFVGLIAEKELDSIRTAMANQDFPMAYTQLSLLPVN